MSGWLQLLAAIALEVAATSLLPATEGFSRPAVTVPALLLYAASFLLLARSLTTLPLSVAYASWSGLGTAAVAAVGVVWLGEELTLTKVVGTALVIAGVVTLELSGRDRGRDPGGPVEASTGGGRRARERSRAKGG